MIKIGIDANRLLDDYRGVGRYLYELLDHFPKTSSEYKFHLFYNSINSKFKKNMLSTVNNNFKNYYYRVPSRFLHTLWNLFSYPKINTLMDDIDIFHSPIFYKLPPSDVPIVVTIHDLAPINLKDGFTTQPQYVNNYLKSLKKLEEKAKGIISVSEYTLKDLKKNISLKDIKHKIIPNGIAEKFIPVRDQILIKVVKKKYDIEKDYFLYIGGASRNKNLEILIEAYSKLPSIIKKKYDMVIAGAKDKLFENLIIVLKKSPVKNNIKLIGYVSETDLPVLYSGAELFIFPSIYEGFGMAPLEAMACGTPVLSSYETALNEVLNDAALRIDPFDSEDIKENISLILEDNEIKQKKISMGLQQAKKYSWDKTAKMTLDFYKEII